MPIAELRAIFARRDFKQLLGTRLVGQFGDGLLQAALATFVLFSPERQPTPQAIAGAFAVLLLPYSLIGPFAGILLDRWRRRNVLVRANLLRAVAVLAVAAVVAVGDAGLGLAITVLVAIGIGRFVLAGLSASLPHVVVEQSLVTANSIKPTLGTFAYAIGAAAGLGLRALAGGGDFGSLVVLAATAVCYLAAAMVARTIAPDHLGPSSGLTTSTARQVITDLRDSLRELRQHPPAARSLLVLTLNRVLIGALTVVLLLLLRQVVHPASDPDAALADFALVAAGLTLGALIAALITPALSRRFGVVRFVSVAMVVAGVAVTPALFSLQVFFLVACAPLIGVANQGSKICADTVLQRNIPDRHLGRVFSVVDMAVNVGTVLGATAVAVTAPADGLSPAGFLAVGAAYLSVAAWYLLASRRQEPVTGQ